jgi:hypothetical protein
VDFYRSADCCISGVRRCCTSRRIVDSLTISEGDKNRRNIRRPWACSVLLRAPMRRSRRRMQTR